MLLRVVLITNSNIGNSIKRGVTVTVKCGKCGEESRDNAKFCKACGTKLGVSVKSVSCPACGKSAQSGDTFCGDCGARMSLESNTETEVEKYDGPWRLTDVVREWIKSGEWEKPLNTELDDMEGTSSTGFNVRADNYEYTGYLETNERPEVFQLFLYANEIEIPAKRLGEANELMRLVNLKTLLGHFRIVVLDDGGGRICNYQAIDVEDASFEPQHIQNMLDRATQNMGGCLPRLAAISEGKSAEEVLSED